MWFVKSRRAQSVDDYETWQEGGVVPTLNVFDNGGDSRATVLIFEATRVDDVRIYENYSPTVATYWGTGGARVPYVFEPKSMLSENWSESTVKNALRANESKSSHAVVYPIQSTVIGRSDNAGPQGKGYGEEIDPMFTLDGAGSHAVAFHHKQTPISGDVSPALGTTSDGMGIMESQSVRRLTPRECERLQGFPDDWTAGQADSSRYRQMGNAVAVPVVQWIIKRIING